MFILAHESMHYAMLHHQRVGWRKPRPANVAMDKVINDILIASNVGTAPKMGIFKDGAREYAWEQLYDENDDGGGGGDNYQPGTGNDDLSGEGMGDLDKAQIEQIKQELIQARQASQKAGKMPAGMDELIDRIINPPVPYHQLLERFMLQMIKVGTSWRRRNKRFAAHDLCMPSYDMKPKMGTMVIQLDESGSIDGGMLANFAMHTNDLIALCNPERVIVLHTSTEVAKVEEFTTEDYPIEFRAATTGGTHMPAGFDWVEANGEEPDVFVCLTDGYTDFGDPPPYPVVWLITTPDLQASHGETIYTEVC